MKVLTVTEGGVVRIGDDIRVAVLSAGPSRVRIGVEAPAEMPIRRGERRCAAPADPAGAGPEGEGS